MGGLKIQGTCVLYFLIISGYLNIATERKVLSEGMTFKAVICENSSQVGVVAEEHPKHVPNLQHKKVTQPPMNTPTQTFLHPIKPRKLIFQEGI